MGEVSVWMVGTVGVKIKPGGIRIRCNRQGGVEGITHLSPWYTGGFIRNRAR